MAVREPHVESCRKCTNKDSVRFCGEKIPTPSHFFQRKIFRFQLEATSTPLLHKMHLTQTATTTMAFSMLAARRGVNAFTNPTAFTRAASTFRPSPLMFAEEGQAEVVLVGCGAPNRGMGWYVSLKRLCLYTMWCISLLITCTLEKE